MAVTFTADQITEVINAINAAGAIALSGHPIAIAVWNAAKGPVTTEVQKALQAKLAPVVPTPAA